MKHFNSKEASQYLKEKGIPFSPRTLVIWRYQGKGPASKKVGGRVFYEKKDLDDFARGRKRQTLDSLDFQNWLRHYYEITKIS